MIYNLPLSRIKSVSGKFRLRPNSLVSIGQFVGTRSVYGPISSVWATEISTAQMERVDWQYLSGFFARLQGQAGLVRMSDPWRRLPLRDQQILDRAGFGTTFFNDGTTFTDDTGWVDGMLPPFGSVDEAESVGAMSLVITGLPASLSPALYMGDLFEVRTNAIPASHGHLYEITGNAPTDANGKTRVSFVPELYANVNAGDQIVLRDATSVFRATSDDEGTIERYLADVGGTGFSLVEERP